MARSKTMSRDRRDRAARALADLPSQRSERQRLGVQCRRAHHLATVHMTGQGLVYESRTGPHSHGSKDFIDTGRRGSRGGEKYVDMLAGEPEADDGLPAWCDCGPHTLSRRELLRSIGRGVRVVRID